MRDIAPSTTVNPSGLGAVQTIDAHNSFYPLYKNGTPSTKSNRPNADPIGADQKFPEPTPVYRVYPGSQSDIDTEDPEVASLNSHIGDLFNHVDPQKKDWRWHYRMVAAVWVDQPRGTLPGKTSSNFREDTRFDDDDPRLAGENRMSNMSMESFTQLADVAAPHCFSCHDTQSQDVVGRELTLPARRINVSHIFSVVAKSYSQTTK